MFNSFNCTNGTSYLLSDIFDMAFPVYTWSTITPRDLAGVTCSTAFSFRLSINCDELREL